MNLNAAKGFYVVGFQPDDAPNPDCCSDPEAMCPECALSVLQDAGLLTDNEDFDDSYDEGLPIPVINWDEDDSEQESERDSGDFDSGIPIPTLW